MYIDEFQSYHSLILIQETVHITLQLQDFNPTIV